MSEFGFSQNRAIIIQQQVTVVQVDGGTPGYNGVGGYNPLFATNRSYIDGYQGGNLLGLNNGGSIVVGGNNAYGRVPYYGGGNHMQQVLGQINGMVAQAVAGLPEFLAQIQQSQMARGGGYSRADMQDMEGTIRQLKKTLQQLRDLSERSSRSERYERSRRTDRSSGRDRSEGPRSESERLFERSSNRVERFANRMMDAIENGETDLSARDRRELMTLLRRLKNAPSQESLRRVTEFLRRHDEEMPDNLLQGLDRLRESVRNVEEYKEGIGVGRRGHGRSRRSEGGHGSERSEGGHGSERSEERRRPGSSAPAAAREAARRDAENLDREHIDNQNVFSPKFLEFLEENHRQFSEFGIHRYISEENLVKAIRAYNREHGEENGFIDPEVALENFQRLRNMHDETGPDMVGITLDDVKAARTHRQREIDRNADRELPPEERRQAQRLGIRSPQFLRFLRDNYDQFAGNRYGIGRYELNKDQLRTAVEAYNRERGEAQGEIDLSTIDDDFDRLRNVHDNWGFDRAIEVEDVQDALNRAERNRPRESGSGSSGVTHV